MEQQIRFCTTSDGVSIAYATLGSGPPLVYVNGWPTHLGLEWEKPFARAFLEALAEGSTLIRYDMRGSGLSDQDLSDFSLESLSKDLEAVVDHLELERFPLLSLGSLAGPIAITYAAAQPQRVTQLILFQGFLCGKQIMPAERQQAFLDYVGTFGVPLFDYIDHPDVDIAAQRDARDHLEAAAPPAMLATLFRTLLSVDVSDVIDGLSMPILTMHARGDPLIPFALGRELAARLPHGKFVPFEGPSTVAWADSHLVIPEIHRFLEIEVKTPEIQRAAERDLITILFTDIEGSAALTARLGDERWLELLHEHNEIVRRELSTQGGYEVKTIGDAFMAHFSSASRALECAITLERAFAARNEEHPDTPVRVRIGLNAGEPIAEEDDLFGTAVNLAARITSQAQGGEILASDVVRQLVAGRGFLFADQGETALRGFEDPVRLFEVRWTE